MYGFIHCALTDLVVGKFGEDVWKTIVEKAGVELGGGSYLIHKIYDDEETLRLVAATCDTLDLDLDTVLEIFGAYFLEYCVNSGYDRILRVLGRNLRDFLCNLDALHDHLASIYPGMEAPSFRCTEDAKSGQLYLHYYSRRKGLEHIVIGLVKAIAKELLETEVQVEIVQERSTEEDHVIFAIRETCSSPTTSKLGLWSFETADGKGKRTRTLSYRYAQKQMSVYSFCKAFPFHVMFDRKLIVKQTGVALMRLIQKTPQQKLLFTDLFELTRPRMEEFSYESVLAHVNAVFIVTTKPGVIIVPPNNTASSGLKDIDGRTQLRLKGQMVFAAESDKILFLCSPRVSNLEELKQRGLYLSDIPLHDATRDLIFMTHARRPERELVEKLEETSNNLKKLEAKLVEDKKNTDELLHSILPKEVAAKLRLDQPVDAENYKLVTILFSDIVGFTALCSNDNVVPMDIVRMLNKLYTYFDMLSGLNDVYKVETIGDAYMVVGGLPKPCDNHAEKVANMALGMMEAAEKVLSPVDKKPLKIRIGIHSGPVMAGVVGKKMPRYCLFGNTVTLANKMESGSKPGFINISSDTRWYLKDYDGFRFTPNTETSNPLRCFFMKGKSSGRRRPSYADIASATAPSSICIFRSPKSSPANSPVPQRKFSAEAKMKTENNESLVCPIRRNLTSGNFKSVREEPSSLLDGLIANEKHEKKRRVTLAKLETTNNNNNLPSLENKKFVVGEIAEDNKNVTMGASFVEMDTDSLSQLMKFKGKQHSSVNPKKMF